MFKVSILFISLVLFFGQSVALNCNATTCAECNTEAGCGWCSATGSCHAGDRDGPSGGVTCLGDFWEFQQCQPCAYQRNCRSCMARGSDCSWCDAIGKCFDSGDHPAGCERLTSCPCNDFAECSGCIGASGCSWCNDDQTCRNDPQTCQMVAHTCPCTDITTCSDCQASGCNWCGDLKECAEPTVNCLIAHSCIEFCLSEGTKCSTCNQLPGCAWCSVDHKCTDAALPDCSVNKFTHTCDDCTLFKSCGSCLDGVGCQWCSDSGSCKEDHVACLSAHTCASYCSNWDSSCSDCLDKGHGCGWCDKTQSCVDVLDAAHCEKGLTFSCSSHHHCGFDGGSFAGGMFLIIGLILLAVAGFFAYRFWQRRQNPQYTELK